MRVWIYIHRQRKEWDAIEIFEISARFTALRAPSAAITCARELMGVSKKLLVPSVIDAAVEKVNQHRITNSKDLTQAPQYPPGPRRKGTLSEPGW